MATDDDILADFMNPQEPKVTFKFSDGSEVLMIKKVMIENSEVFKAMLDEERWAEGSNMEINIENESTFTGSDTISSDYKIFINAMCGKNFGEVGIPTLINVYAIAHKYQVQKIKKSSLVAIQLQVKKGNVEDPPQLELLLGFLSTYGIALDFTGIGCMVVICDLEVRYQAYAIAHKYQVESIKKLVLRYHKRDMEQEKIREPKDLESLLKFISTYKLSGLDTFNLDITRDNYLDFFRVLKKFDDVRARRQLARFMIDNKIPFDSFPADLRKQLTKIQAMIISDQELEIVALKKARME